MKSTIDKLKNLVFNRFILFGLFILLFVVVQYVFYKSILPSNDTKDLWFYSGILMVLFSMLFIEPYYSSPKNVLTNVLPLLILFFAIKSTFENVVFWYLGIIILLIILISSIIAITLNNKSLSKDNIRNRISENLKNFVVVVGQGKVLYSSIFIYFLLSYYSIQNLYTLILLIVWFFILIINPKDLHNDFLSLEKENRNSSFGEIFSVQSRNIFLVKVFSDKVVNKFDIVQFQYAFQDKKSLITIGIVFDIYILNKEVWGKVLMLSQTPVVGQKFEKDMVYRVTDLAEFERLKEELKIDKIVGIVSEKSSIGKLRFEYSKKGDDLQEGDLLELFIGSRKIFYQVINGITDTEKLENKDETGYIEGEAILLGEWNNKEMCFEKYGWVPPINTPVYIADTNDLVNDSFEYPFYKLGNIPGTKLPAVINLHEAISHHIALIGITGAGKSFLAREMINAIKTDTKVICVDFNKEFITTLNPAPKNIISDVEATQIAARIEIINNELEKFGNQQDKKMISTKLAELKGILKSEIEKFIVDPNQEISVFELPDVSNTTGILDYTKYFFKVLFEIAKERQIKGDVLRVCVVLEEAHTVIPEWNFSGSTDKNSQAIVNSIGQIALQGRKYGIGFLIIAQRTANVSKTVLTQCNSVICFQAFDETSFNFIGNYVGKDIVLTLPHLKKFHAVIAGKAIKSNIPLIVDLTRLPEIS